MRRSFDTLRDDDLADAETIGEWLELSPENVHGLAQGGYIPTPDIYGPPLTLWRVWKLRRIVIDPETVDLLERPRH